MRRRGGVAACGVPSKVAQETAAAEKSDAAPASLLPQGAGLMLLIVEATGHW